jgi:hypothetical protein
VAPCTRLHARRAAPLSGDADHVRSSAQASDTTTRLAEPIEIDFEGLNPIAPFRQPQVGFTKRLPRVSRYPCQSRIPRPISPAPRALRSSPQELACAECRSPVEHFRRPAAQRLICRRVRAPTSSRPTVGGPMRQHAHRPRMADPAICDQSAFRTRGDDLALPRRWRGGPEPRTVDEVESCSCSLTGFERSDQNLRIKRCPDGSRPSSRSRKSNASSRETETRSKPAA